MSGAQQHLPGRSNMHAKRDGEGLTRRDFMLGSAAAALAVAGSRVGGAAAADAFGGYGAYDALGLAELVRSKEVTPEELLEAAIARIERVNPKINAVVTKMYDEARATIASVPEGPFTGVPFLLKDLGPAYAGVRNTSGSRMFAEYVPDYDSELTVRYKRAGLVVAGRTNTPEFGLNVTTESQLLGPARNPWNLEHSTGGSSGGTAAAIAAGIVPAAHGNDGGGSIRIPASACGVFGLKPSRGRTPTGPEFGEIWEGFAIDHALSRTVRDSAALLDATSAPEVGAPYAAPPPPRPYLEEAGADPGRLRIAFSANAHPATTVHADCIAAMEDAARLCESLGHVVEAGGPEIAWEPVRAAFKLVVGAHTAAMLDGIGMFLGQPVTAEMVEPNTWSWAEIGWKASAAELAGSKAMVNIATRTVAGALAEYDLLLSPTLGQPPVKLGVLDTTDPDWEGLVERIFDVIPFTWLYNLTGHPAMSVPLAWNAAGLPVGVQFTGRYGDEGTMFRLAAQLEDARPWRDRRPPVAA
jgi:Asp-tRNA(Asn)/Glu-tRNA(Gln) amidotransferase A subunit family amidase